MCASTLFGPGLGLGAERAPPHVVTAEEAAAGTFAITDVVLPMPGKHSQPWRRRDRKNDPNICLGTYVWGSVNPQMAEQSPLTE